MEQNKPNGVLVLDYSTWRCGGEGENTLGEGSTAMCNVEGFKCCLGHFLPQLGSNITDEDMINTGTPAFVARHLILLNKDVRNNILLNSDSLTTNSHLSLRAVSINDDPNTTPQEKIDRLKPLSLEAGYEIEVINQPVIETIEQITE